MATPEPFAISSPPAFVGRSRELGLLLGHLDTARKGEPRIVLVEGEAGVGKTRLAREVQEHARQREFQTCFVRFVEGSGVPFQSFRSSLIPELRRAGVLDIPHLGRAAAALEALEGDHESFTPSQPRGDQAGVGPALAAGVLALARRRPLLLVIDDFQSGNSAERDAVVQIAFALGDAALTHQARVVLCLVLRPPEPDSQVARQVERIRRETVARPLTLSGLDEAEIGALVRAVTAHSCTPGLLFRIAGRTRGNPLFVIETLDNLDRRGALATKGGALESPLEPGDLPLPAELARTIADRVDGIAEDLKGALTIAALLGDDFTVSRLVAALDLPEERVIELMDAAIAGRLVEEDGWSYRFAHPLIRDALRLSASTARRQRLHATIAQRLMARSPHDISVIADQLASAGQVAPTGEAAAYALRAGHEASRLNAWATAIRYYELALAGLNAGQLGQEERPNIEFNLALALHRGMDRKSSIPHYDEALAGFQAAGMWADVARTLTERARAQVAAAVPVDRVALIQDAERLEGLLPGCTVELWTQISSSAYGVGEALEARIAADRALELARIAGDESLRSEAHFSSGLAHWLANDPRQARSAFQDSLAAARRVQDSLREGNALSRIALAWFQQGELELATSVAREAQQHCRTRHEQSSLAVSLAVEFLAAAARFDDEGAEILALTAGAHAERSGHAWVPLMIQPALASLRAARGDLAGARDALHGGTIDGGTTPRRLGSGSSRMLSALIEATFADASGIYDGLAESHLPDLRRRAPEVALPYACAFTDIAMLAGRAPLIAGLSELMDAALERGLVIATVATTFIPRVRANALLLDGKVELAFAAYLEAAELARRQGMALEAGRVALDHARALEREGREDEAATRLAAAALQAFQEAGAHEYARHARAFLGMPVLDRAEANANPGDGADAAPLAGGFQVIMVSDIGNSTHLNHLIGDERWVRGVLVEHDAILSRAIGRHGGRRVKHTGDGVFATFPSIPDALLAARDVAIDFEQRQLSAPDTPLAVRVGLNAGEALSSGHDLFGTAVTAAHRICALAKDNQVLVSASVMQAAAGHGFTFEDCGVHDMKGFPERMQLWELRP